MKSNLPRVNKILKSLDIQNKILFLFDVFRYRLASRKVFLTLLEEWEDTADVLSDQKLVNKIKETRKKLAHSS